MLPEQGNQPQKRSQSACGSLMLPPNQSALLRSHRIMLQKLLSFWVSSLMPCSSGTLLQPAHAPLQSHRSVPQIKGAALGSSRIVGCHQLYNCLHGWPLTSGYTAHSVPVIPQTTCISFQRYLEIHSREDASAVISEQFPAGKGSTNNVWGYKQRRGQQLRLDETWRSCLSQSWAQHRGQSSLDRM